MSATKRNILVSGGAGFIGSHLVRLLVSKYPDYQIINVDALTYAGNLENLKDVDQLPNYQFIKGDITNLEQMRAVFSEYAIDGVFHCAAESHVDRSIADPLVFVHTNVMGTAVLLQVAKEQWTKEAHAYRFLHISTDEVYGSLGPDGLFTEQTAYDPRSPYSASKASSDHLVKVYGHTFGLPVVVSNCSNNYGPFQFPEKLLPLFIRNIVLRKPLPVYGKGENVRDWLYVEDHVAALDTIFHGGKPGETYNVGGNNEWKNIDLVQLLCRLMDEQLGRELGESAQLISYVQDRAGHDLRYAIDASKIKNELGWEPLKTFEEGLKETIHWYLNNELWLQRVTSGAYMDYYEKQYSNR